jgi:hypothetical protein
LIIKYLSIYHFDFIIFKTSQLASNSSQQTPQQGLKNKAERPVSYYQPQQVNERLLGKERSQSGSPPIPSSSNVTSFQPKAQQQEVTVKRSASQVTSNTYFNVISPLLTQLAADQRRSTASASNSTTINLEQKIDELKSAFYHLEQQNPGACDAFIKNIFSILKPSSEQTTASSSH